ncbi:hypothetical protein HanHA89_Chr01g0018421 [Helianthus annuus]|nr:hypothetical protein HanHA89_Chr01g0018421 [Helianthus annuus]
MREEVKMYAKGTKTAFDGMPSILLACLPPQSLLLFTSIQQSIYEWSVSGGLVNVQDLENVDKTDKVERRRSSREKRPVERRRLYRQALVQPKKKRVEQSKKKKGI